MAYRIDRLVDRGLVRRSTSVELRDAGVTLAERVQTQINALETKAVSGLEPDERSILMTLVRKMLAGLTEAAGDRGRSWGPPATAACDGSGQKPNRRRTCSLRRAIWARRWSAPNSGVSGGRCSLT
jgi:hypothetical protein